MTSCTVIPPNLCQIVLLSTSRAVNHRNESGSDDYGKCCDPCWWVIVTHFISCCKTLCAIFQSLSSGSVAPLFVITRSQLPANNGIISRNLRWWNDLRWFDGMRDKQTHHVKCFHCRWKSEHILISTVHHPLWKAFFVRSFGSAWRVTGDDKKHIHVKSLEVD